MPVEENEPDNFAKPLLGFVGFCLRHFFASFVVVSASCIVWTVAYVLLLLWALFSDSGLGGPLAYPAGLLFVFIATGTSVILLLFPSTALAELVARRRKLAILFQIPISIGWLALLCLGVTGIVQILGSTGVVTNGFFAVFGLIFLIELLPLGLYWWMAQGGPVLLSIVKWFRADKRP